MTPFDKFLMGLRAVRHEFNEEMSELIGFAEVMARSHNAVELDENGFYYVSATGPLEEVIPTLEKQLDKLNRIKRQKDQA